MIDEHAGELVADGLVDEQRGHRRVDASGQRAEHSRAADLGADPVDLHLDNRGRRPNRGCVGDVVEEVLQDLHPVSGVRDLRVELDAVEGLRLILEGGDRRRRGARDDARPPRRRGDRVAMAHPRDLLGRQAGEQPALGLGVELGAAELRHSRPLDAPAELLRHQLHAVADPEHRHARLEQGGVDPWSSLRVDRSRPAGEHDRARAPATDLSRRERRRNELRVDAALADAAGDELRVLTAEVDDQHRPLLGLRFAGRERNDVRLRAHRPGR